MDGSKIKIICTIGPSSNKLEVLERFVDRGVDFFRINLSHTEEEKIGEKIRDLDKYGIPIIIDTEGQQVRSGNTEEFNFLEGQIIKIHGKKINCDNENLFLNPIGVIKKLQEGDLISLDFNSLSLRVLDISTIKDDYILCKVILGGKIGGKKAVNIQSPTFNLPPFSLKDHKAIELAKKHGVTHFTLSFMESPSSVIKFKELYPHAKVYSKIESKKGLDNFLDIAKVSDGILIDRGDLSSQVPIEKIPFIQKYIINKVREIGKEVFIATNTLEQMSFELKPNKAEVNDIINTLLDGATGIALTKETAVGRYPVETVNMLVTLVNQFEFISKNEKEGIINKIEDSNYLYGENVPELLTKPHGGKLVNRFFPNYNGEIPKTKIIINEETLMDLEQIGTGAFSPIEGFMDQKDFDSVVDNMRLSNGLVWTIPIVLSIDEELKNKVKINEEVALMFNDEIYGIINVSDIYSIYKEERVKKIYGTSSIEHPGVKNFMSLGNYFVGGKIILLKKRKSSNKIYELTPSQTRKIFTEKNWSKVIGFHTRNVIHKSHEFIQLEGIKKSLCDGLFVHPVIGKKKKGDFESEAIISSYEKMISDFYPKSKVIFGTFATSSRYAGPREAIFTALTRKNFGCSHFIVGRDHTGVGNFYEPNASHEIFNQFTKEELGIIPIMFNNVFYSELGDAYIHESEFIEHPVENRLDISGTEAREMLSSCQQLPEWYMRPEISEMIINKIKNGEKVFVE